MKKSSIIISVIALTSLTNCDSTSDSYTAQNNNDINTSSWDNSSSSMPHTLDQIPESANTAPKEQISEYDEHYLNSLLNVVKSETKYNPDFAPTVHLTVQNATEKTITAFEIEVEDVPNVVKRFKTIIKPAGTYSISFKPQTTDAIPNATSIKITKIIYSNGQMEESY